MKDVEGARHPPARAHERSLDIVFLTQTYPRYDEDTAGPFIRDLARGLVARGDRVTVLTPHMAGLRPGWDDSGVDVKTFRYAPSALEVLGYGRSLEADERVRAAAGAVLPLYALAARRALARELDRRARDVLHAHWVVPNGVVAAGLFGLPAGASSRPASAGCVLAIGLHGSDVFLAERRLARTWVARALRRCRLLTGCSAELVERIEALGSLNGPSRVIPYGVDADLFRPGDDAIGWRKRLAIPDSAPVVLAVGRMASKKGFDVLVEALPELLDASPELHVVLAGGGDRLEEWRAATVQYTGRDGVARVHLPGRVERDVLPDLYRAADLFVLPAVHDAAGNVDGLPNVILEAMASGLATVASGISGIPLALRDGVDGALVPEREPLALARALASLANDPNESSRRGANARLRVEQELTWTAIAQRYRAAYLEGLSGTTSTSGRSGLQPPGR